MITKSNVPLVKTIFDVHNAMDRNILNFRSLSALINDARAESDLLSMKITKGRRLRWAQVTVMRPEGYEAIHRFNLQ